MRRYLKYILCLICVVFIMTVQSAHSGFLDDLKKKSSDMLKGAGDQIKKGVEKIEGKKASETEETVKSETGQSNPPVLPGKTTAPPDMAQGKGTDGDEFSQNQEPDYRALFKMYMAEHNELLDSTAMALEYYLLFNSNKEECNEIRTEGNNEFYRDKLINRVRPRFTKDLKDARSWPKTAVFRMKGNRSLGKYDKGKSMFPFTSYQLQGGQFKIARNKELCRHSFQKLDGMKMIPGGNWAERFYLEFSGGEKLKGFPLPLEQAEAFIKSTPQRRVDIELLIRTETIPFMATAINQTIPARVIAARLLNPAHGRVLYTYDPSIFRQKTLAETGYPLTPDIMTLLAVRHMPDALEGETLRKITEQMIKTGGEPVFRPQQIMGRDPKFASEELAPEYKKFVEKAAAQLPKRIRIKSQYRIGKPNYDSSKGVFRFISWHPVSKSRNAKSIPAAVWDMAVYEFRTMGRPMIDKESLDAARVIPKISSRDTRLFPNITLLALDRWIEIKDIPVERSRAEKMKALKGYFMLVIEFTVKDMVGAARSGNTRTSGTLIAGLDKVTIFDPNDDVFASFSPDTLPSAKERYAVAQAQSADKTKTAVAAKAQAEKKKKQKAADMRSKKDKINKKLTECETIVSPKDRLSCFEDVCSTVKGGNESNRCISGKMKASSQIDQEKSKAKSMAKRKVRNCEQRASSDWKLNKGSEEYNAAVKGCVEEEDRVPYGPDILGLRLGMTWGDADKLIKREMDLSKAESRKHVVMATEPRPFKDGRLYFSKEGDHGVAFYHMRNNDNERVAAVSRRLYFDGKGESSVPVRKALVEKYGKVDWSKGNTLLWATSGGPSLGARCAKLADKLLPAELSRKKWKSGESGSLRTIFMIGAEGTPGDYSMYEACGPVLIARLNKNKSGKIKDMSMVLFDPSWIASQPAAAFKIAKKKMRF